MPSDIYKRSQKLLWFLWILCRFLWIWECHV